MLFTDWRVGKNMQMFKKIIITILFIFFTVLPGFTTPNVSKETEVFQEAESFYYSKNYPLALETFTEFADRFPLSQLVPDVQYKRALCMFHMKRFDDSFALFEKIEQRLRSTRYLDFISFWKGMIHFQKKEY
ncbi:MAG: tetratricopeptide repeat protein, partial [Spirochaetaceae bacterium]